MRKATILLLLAAFTLSTPGCKPAVEKDAVKAKANVTFGSPTYRKEIVTSQPTDVKADQQAGRDARQIPITVNISGSGWPFVLVVLAIAGLALLHLKNARKLKRIWWRFPDEAK